MFRTKGRRSRSCSLFMDIFFFLEATVSAVIDSGMSLLLSALVIHCDLCFCERIN